MTAAAGPRICCEQTCSSGVWRHADHLPVVVVTFDEAPTPDEVADLYAAATQGPPLSEPRAQADAYAELFRSVLTRGDAAWVESRLHGALVGLAYGHHWRWAVQTDQWSSHLRER